MVRKRDKFARDLVVGGSAAAISKTAVAPIERVKLLLQVQYSHRDIAADQRYKGILDAFSRVPKEQGFLSFWRGNLTNVARYFPTQALNFAFNDLYKTLLLRHTNRDLDFWKYTGRSLASGGLAGSTTLCFVYPLDFIRTRLSADIGSNPANRTYKGFTDCLVKTVKTEGVTGLYRGFLISIQTYFIYRAVYFGMYDTIRHFVVKDKKKLHFIGSFLIAQTVSATSAYITYPWDTVRRRMMIKGTLTQGHAVHVAKQIVREEGVRGLFKGALANVFRSGGGALVMAIYEEIQKHLRRFPEISLILIWLSVLILSLGYAERPKFEAFNPFRLSPVDRKYATFTEADMEEARNQAKEMYYFAYNNYMKHAYPADELDPINCKGRGHDHANPQNININDVLGDYSLTLVDGMGTLAVMGDVKEFHKAVRTVIRDLSFNKNTTVQVFEATIRVMGPLLSAHLLVTGQNILQGDFTMKGYNGELLALAKDLANRLMPAFRGTATGLPFTRVNLQKGVLLSEVNETCTAGAGSLLLEFGILSRLTGDETYEAAARGVNDYLWSKREGTGLPGSLINIQTGEWTSTMTGVGAGSDSYYELMLKAHILFGDKEDLNRYNKWYAAALRTMRRGRYLCARGIGEHPIYVNVDARDGTTANTWVDSLQASFAGVLTLAGDIEEAVCAHALHYGIWRRFGVLPERFDYHNKRSVLHFYPLRPELAESTYYLYLATKNPFYLHVGREIMDSINTMTRVKCGFATVHDVHSGGVEDRMESFFVAETMKYLYLLFDPQNLVNKNSERLIFSTEGHIFPILEEFQRKPEEVYKVRHTHKARLHRTGPKKPYIPHPDEKAYIYERAAQDDACDSGRPLFYTYRPVLVEFYMELLFEMVGLNPQWWS